MGKKAQYRTSIDFDEETWSNLQYNLERYHEVNGVEITMKDYLSKKINDDNVLWREE